jgi:hypothetical protein
MDQTMSGIRISWDRGGPSSFRKPIIRMNATRMGTQKGMQMKSFR